MKNELEAGVSNTAGTKGLGEGSKWTERGNWGLNPNPNPSIRTLKNVLWPDLLYDSWTRHVTCCFKRDA